MKQPTPTIALTGGGSGGHITPLLPLARELKKLSPNCQIIYIGQKGDHFDGLRASSSDFDFTAYVRAGKFRRYHGESIWSHLVDVKTIALNVRDFFRVIHSVGTSLSILRKTRPDVVFSKGGFVAVPVGVAARILRIPIVTHDSDAVPGLANRILGRWAVIHATGQPVAYYPYPRASTIHVGIPISQDVKKVSLEDQAGFKKELGVPTTSQLLFVAGGGNGARTINQLLNSAAPGLLRNNQSLYIVHLTGQVHEAAVKEEYKSMLGEFELERVRVLGFTNDFYKYVGAADLIISRAGATVLEEFAVSAKACIIIPSPFLAGGHQLKNAEELMKHDAAVVIGNEIQADELVAVIDELLTNNTRRLELAKNLNVIAKPGAAVKLAEIILKIATKQGV